MSLDDLSLVWAYDSIARSLGRSSADGPPASHYLKGSGGEAVGYAICVRLCLADARWQTPWIDRQSH